MNTFEKIKVMKSLLPNDEAAVKQAEKTLWDTFVAMRQQAGASDFIRALDGEPQQKKEKPSLLAAREALEQLRELGKKANMEFPVLATDEEFIEWLVRDYVLYALMAR